MPWCAASKLWLGVDRPDGRTGHGSLDHSCASAAMRPRRSRSTAGAADSFYFKGQGTRQGTKIAAILKMGVT